MDELARAALARLLASGEKREAGVRVRTPALTASALEAYRGLRSLQDKEAFEAPLLDAKARGIIALTWDRRGPEDGFIARVDLLDAAALAHFIGVAPAAELQAQAVAALASSVTVFPVLTEVLQRWAMMKTVRGYRAHDVAAWQDAVRVVLYARAELERNPEGMPVRVASARLFHDSKRIENLTGALDVLLAGSVQAEVRDPVDLWSELNLFREEQPVRMAGRIPIERTRVTALLDAPYAAFSAAAIVGLVSDTLPQRVLSIENLTTFHLEAKRRCEESVLLLYTAGTPSPPWRAMYGRLLERLPRTTPLQHWGDLDEGGFRIAAQIATEALRQGHVLQPWQMHPSDVPVEHRRPVKPSTIARMQYFAREAGWAEHAAAIGAAGFTVEQEALEHSP